MPERTPPEAELQARFDQALAAAFPLLDAGDLHHEKRFSIRLGHSVHDEDAVKIWAAGGRADIIVRQGELDLAVVELKREDQIIDAIDVDQGMSYARQMEPRPPFVVVSNGLVTEVYASESGDKLEPNDLDAGAVVRLFENAGKIANASLKRAVEALLGPRKDIWVTAVRAETDKLITSMTGDGLQKPFSANLHVPRNVTDAVIRRLDAGELMVLVTGPPGIGKTSMLRDLAIQTKRRGEYVVFMLRGGAHGPGLFRHLANALGSAVGWPVKEDDARAWLSSIRAKATSPQLVLAINDLVAHTPLAQDIEELAHDGLGEALRVVATVDDPDLITGGSRIGRETAIGALAQGAETVPPLDDGEFGQMVSLLKAKRIEFTPGARTAAEYRALWLVRTLVDHAVASDQYRSGTSRAFFPATLGAHFIDEVRERNAKQTKVLNDYRQVAALAFTDDRVLPRDLALELANTFAVRRDLFDGNPALVNQLIEQGWMRPFRRLGLDLITPTEPGIYASELASVVSKELGKQCEDDPIAAGTWLISRMDRLFLGDLVGAQGIRDLAESTGSFPVDLISPLLQHKPSIQPASSDFVLLDNGRQLHFHLSAIGRLYQIKESGDRTLRAYIPNQSDRPKMYVDTIAWQILSQLALFPAAAAISGSPRADLMLMQEIGACRFPLFGQGSLNDSKSEHEVDGMLLLCQEDGVVEPITAAMHQVLASEGSELDAWIDGCLARASLPLAHRLHIALSQLVNLSDHEKAVWARRALAERVTPSVHRLANPETRASRRRAAKALRKTLSPPNPASKPLRRRVRGQSRTRGRL